MKRRWKITLGVIGLGMVLLLTDHELRKTACANVSSPDSLNHAREQKRGMLSRSIPSFQHNFANSEGRVVGRTDQGSTLVEFRGKDGKTLTARIDQDCYIGWSESI
jgi:hypothetical protein